MERLISGESTIYLDDRHFPVIISTWYGTADMGNVKGFAAWHERQNARALREGVGMVSISDSSHATRPPPDVRRFFADWMSSNADGDDASIVSIAVITSALVRGAMTAIGWVRPEIAEITVVATMKDAIAAALEALKSAGIPSPPALDPETYVIPARPPTAADETDEKTA